MDGGRIVKVAFYLFFILFSFIFINTCQSPLFQIPYQAKNDLKSQTDYHNKTYISKNAVGQSETEKLNVMITDTDVSIYIWIGNNSFPDEDKRFDISNSAIDGEAPHYAFNNNEVVGKLTLISKNVINVSFATLYPPYLNIQNVSCSRNE